MPILLPCTASCCFTMENEISDLPTNIISDTRLGGIYPGHLAHSGKTIHAVYSSTGINTANLHIQSPACEMLYCHYSLPGS